MYLETDKWYLEQYNSKRKLWYSISRIAVVDITGIRLRSKPEELKIKNWFESIDDRLAKIESILNDNKRSKINCCFKIPK